MTEYEHQLFKGKCPYTDEPCGENIDCRLCEVGQREIHYIGGEDEE